MPSRIDPRAHLPGASAGPHSVEMLGSAWTFSGMIAKKFVLASAAKAVIRARPSSTETWRRAGQRRQTSRSVRDGFDPTTLVATVPIPAACRSRDQRYLLDRSDHADHANSCLGSDSRGPSVPFRPGPEATPTVRTASRCTQMPPKCNRSTCRSSAARSMNAGRASSLPSALTGLRNAIESGSTRSSASTNSSF